MAKLYYKSGSSWISGISLIYPVGALYQSFSSTSPATLFGGTWSQISNRVIRAASNTSAGGADTVTLGIDHIPKHRHGLNIKKAASEALHYGFQYDGTGFKDRGIVTTPDTVQIYSQYTGAGKSFSKLPAYQNCYTWRRTA